MRRLAGAILLCVGGAAVFFVMVLPPGYAPWGALAATGACVALVAGVGLVKGT